MLSRMKAFSVVFFILLLTLPFQVFADEKGDPRGHGEEKKETEQEQTEQKLIENHGHGDKAEDYGHEGDQRNDGHGENNHVDDEKVNDGHGEDNHVDNEKVNDGHGDDGHGEGDQGDGHGDGGHDDGGQEENFEELGPNLPVLSTFAVINGGFLLFGAIRKANSNRRKRGF